MRSIKLGEKTYEYEYLSLDLNRIILLCGQDKTADAIDRCADLVRPNIQSTADTADLRSLLGQAIMEDIMGRLSTLKNSPVPSERSPAPP